MPDTTTHSQDPHDPAEPSHVDKARQNVRSAEVKLDDAKVRLDIAQQKLRRAQATRAGEVSPAAGDTFLVNDLLGVMQPLTRDDVKEIVKEALADFDPLAADVDAILRDRGVEVKPGESPYLALLRSIPVNADATKERATKTSRNAASREAAWSQTPENVDPKAWAAGLRQIDSFFNFDEPLVDLIERMSHVAGEPSNLRRRSFLDKDPVEQALHDSHDSLVVRVVLVDERVGVSHETSPSVVDAGAHSVGDGPGAGDASATPATEVTDNWDTGKMAGHVEVIKVDGDPTQLLIDGEPFPYLLAAEPFKVLAGEDDATRVTVTLFAEKITESERLTSDPSKPYVHFSRGGFPATEGSLSKRLHDSVVRKSEALGRVEKAERKLCSAREDLAYAENEQRDASAAYDAFIFGGSK